MTDEDIVGTLMATMTAHLRSMGIALIDDAGNRIVPNSYEEQQVMHTIAHGVIQAQCHTHALGSSS